MRNYWQILHSYPTQGKVLMSIGTDTGMCTDVDMGTDVDMCTVVGMCTDVYMGTDVETVQMQVWVQM